MENKAQVSTESRIEEDVEGMETNDSSASVEECQNLMKKLVLQTQNILSTKNRENKVLTRVLKRLSEVDYNERFFNVALHHSNIISTVLKRDIEKTGDLVNHQFVTYEECTDYYIAKMFFEKMDLFEAVPYSFDSSNSDLIKIVPIQCFMKKTEEAKRKFESNIKKNDILYVEVLKNYNVHPDPVATPDEAKFVEMRIVSKINLTNKSNKDHDVVYHLDSHAFMYRSTEFERLGRTEILTSELLSVVALGIACNRIIVTTNKDSLRIDPDLKQGISLGFVSPSDLPFDLDLYKTVKQKGYRSYSSYLKDFPHFYYSHNLANEIKSIEIDPLRLYSFCNGRDGSTIPSSKTASSLVEAAKLNLHHDAHIWLNRAKKFVEAKEYLKAEKAFDESLRFWPENYQVFEVRGKMNLSLAKKKFRRGRHLKSALFDLEMAIELNPSAVESKKCLSDIFVYLSKRPTNQKNFELAKEFCKRSLKLCPDNKDAIAMLRKIDKKAARFVINEDLIDLTTLEKQKQILQKKLKKEKLDRR